MVTTQVKTGMSETVLLPAKAVSLFQGSKEVGV